MEVDLGTLAIEALAEGWFDLMPRPGRSDVVAGRVFLSLIIVPKDRSEDDSSGLDAFPWLDRKLYKAKGHARQYNVIQVACRSSPLTLAGCLAAATQCSAHKTDLCDQA